MQALIYAFLHAQKLHTLTHIITFGGDILYSIRDLRSAPR